MDYFDDSEQSRFRDELVRWLAANAPSEPVPLKGTARAHHLQDWHRTLHAAGWMGLSWPEAYGGRGLASAYEAIFNDELGRAGSPPAPHVGFLGRALLEHGTEQQRLRYLPGLLSGDEIWCQGFSEPQAGSDLAALTTSARPTEHGFVINGQKVWTSDAASAHWCLLLARTDPNALRHNGISALVVDMATRGIEVRPIVQINGDEEFNEVYFTDVDVPADAIVGTPGQGWQIAMTTVSYERGPADVGFSSRYLRTLTELEDLARDTQPDKERLLDLARAHVQVEVLRAHVARSLSARDQGHIPGPEGSIDKLLATRTEQSLHHAAMGLQARAAVTGAAPRILGDYFYSRAASIAGGTSQIQCTLIAERLLGMPRGR